MNNFKKLTPSELSSIHGGGIWDNIKQGWNDFKASVRQAFEDFTQGLYDSTGCSGQH